MTTAIAWFGGAAAWSLHLVLSYLVVGLVCGPAPSVAADVVQSLGGPIVWLTAISVLTAAGAAGSALVAYLVWSGRAGAAGRDGDGRRGMAFVGLALNLLFLVVIAFGATAPFFLPAC